MSLFINMACVYKRGCCLHTGMRREGGGGGFGADMLRLTTPPPPPLPLQLPALRTVCELFGWQDTGIFTELSTSRTTGARTWVEGTQRLPLRRPLAAGRLLAQERALRQGQASPLSSRSLLGGHCQRDSERRH